MSGMAQNGINIEVVIISPEMARDILDFSEKSGSRNRRLSPAVVKRYANDMKRGNWKTTGAAISLTSEGILIDGQHRLNAIVVSGVPVEMVVARGVQKDAFNVMDQGKRRDLADLLYIDGFRQYTSYIGAAAKQIHYYVTHGGFIANYIHAYISYNEVRIVVEHHQDEMIDAAREYLGASKGGRSLLPPSVFIALWVLFGSVDPRRNAVFMNTIMTGVNLSEDDPRLVLRRYLIDIKNSKGVKTRDMAFLAAYVIAAWNKFISGQTCQHLRLPQKNKFPAISGFDKSGFAWGATDCPEKEGE